MLKYNKKLFWQKQNLVCLKVKHTKTFFGKHFYYFFSTFVKNLFKQIHDFYKNIAVMLLQKGNFYCKAPKICIHFSVFQKKTFRMFNRAPLDTLKVFFF